MKQNIIAGIVIIVLVACFAIFNVATQKEPVEYFKVVGTKAVDNSVIDEYRILKNLVKNSELKESMTISTTFEKYNILEYFNEEYFTNKKVAMVVVYEDNTKDYEYSIDDIVYNEDRTEAIVYYTYKSGTYAGTFATTWYNYMFVELDGTVENVDFILDNKSSEEK